MNVIIVSNSKSAKTVDALYQIIAYFDAQGISHTELDVTDLPDAAFAVCATPEEVRDRFGEGYDLIVTLGGDGTLLHSGRLANVLDAPILGMNFGHLGFLTNKAEDGAIPLIADTLADEIIHEERVNLDIHVHCFGDDEEKPELARRFYALNEIVIARGAMGHIVDFTFDISGERVAELRGDGIIVSTATGSTAYALSAGGPLVGPSHRGMIVAPLAPHTLYSRAIVTEHHDIVEVSFKEDSASSREVSLFADGDALEFERPISSIIVKTGAHPTTLLTRREETFYKQISRTFFK